MTFYAAISGPVLCTGDMSEGVWGSIWTQFLPRTSDGLRTGSLLVLETGRTLELPNDINSPRTSKVNHAHL
jgi:hypothetical protein